MSRKLVAVVMGLIVLTAFFLRVRSSIPVLRVDGININREDFLEAKGGLLRFRDLNKNDVSDSEIERGVLLSFIGDYLVRKELEKRGKSDDIIKNIVDGTISKDVEDKVETATSQLYGWSIDEFEKIVLAPQARRTLLDEELRKENSNLESWLEKSLKEARISIYLLRWKWSDGEVKERF